MKVDDGVVRCITFPDEYKGHSLLEACRQADATRLKKFLSPEVINFKHPYTGNTPLVSVCVCVCVCVCMCVHMCVCVCVFVCYELLS